MSKSSCISHPANEKLVLIREWQLKFCEGNHCAAALLSLFEYWHNIRIEQSMKSRRSNDIAEMHGDQRMQDESFLQFHNEDDLEISLLGLYGKTKIGEAIAKLQTLGAIEVTKNPNPRYAFDKTRYFLFNADLVNDWLDNDYYDSDESNLTDGQIENSSRKAKNSSPQVKSNDSTIISEITTEITNRVNSDSFSNINHQEASIPQVSTNIQEDPKTAENILDLQRAKEIVKNYFNTNGKYEKEIHRKLKPTVVKNSLTDDELIQQLEAAGTIWKWFGKNEPRPQAVQSYQKEYPKNGHTKIETNVETGLERWTRDFMIGKLIPFDTELNDDQQRLFYNRKSHPKIFQPAYDGNWPQEEILRRYEIYMSRGGYYAKAGHPLALFVSQFDQFAKRKKRMRVDKSKLLFGGRTETDGSGDFVFEMPPEQRAKMHAEDKALAEKYRKERLARNGEDDEDYELGLKLEKLNE